MQILLDHNVPLPLRRVLRERLATDIVDTTAFHGWQTLTNGELLHAAETSGFDLFISADQNLS